MPMTRGQWPYCADNGRPGIWFPREIIMDGLDARWFTDRAARMRIGELGCACRSSIAALLTTSAQSTDAV